MYITYKDKKIRIFSLFILVCILFSQIQCKLDKTSDFLEKETFIFAEEIINDLFLSKINITYNEDFLEKILDEIQNFFQNLHLKESNRLNSTDYSNFPIKPHNDSLLCKSCIKTFNFINKIIKETYGKTGILKLFNIICRVGLKYSKKACNLYISQYTPVIIESLLDHYITGEYLCSYKMICKEMHVEILNPDDYANQILKDKPQNKNVSITNNTSVWKVLHLTDMHTDLNYLPGSIGDCSDPVCCQSDNKPKALKFLQENSIGIYKKNEFNKTPTEFFFDDRRAGKWGYLGKCDIPLHTTQNMFEYIFSNSSTIPDFIIWTGDNPSHSLWNLANQEEVYNITKILSDLMNQFIKKSEKNIPIYPTLGNHEKFPNDQFYPYDSKKEKDLLQTYGNLWRDWLGEEAYLTFSNFGYYSKKHLETNLRIISYNCLYCDSINFYLIKNPTDPNDQIAWLEKELRKAEQNGEVVYLISHIPTIDEFFLIQCQRRFKALLDRFSYIIRGHFTGHTHKDHTNVQYEYFENSDRSPEITGIIFTSPGLTTYTNMNPSFRIYEIDTESKMPLNYLQYGFNLTLANLFEENVPEWKIRYNASEFFRVKNLTDYKGIRDFLVNLENDAENFDKMLSYFYSEGKDYESNRNNEKTKRVHYCRFVSESYEEFLKCSNIKFFESDQFIFQLINLIDGKWYIRYVDEN